MPRVDAIGGSCAGRLRQQPGAGRLALPRDTEGSCSTRVQDPLPPHPPRVGGAPGGRQRRRRHRARPDPCRSRTAASSASPWGRARPPGTSTRTATSPGGSTNWPSPPWTTTARRRRRRVVRRPRRRRALLLAAVRLPSGAGGGIDFPDDVVLAERSSRSRTSSTTATRAREDLETIGVYLGYAIAHYADFYDFKHLLILGRCTSGGGGTDPRRRPEGARRRIPRPRPADQHPAPGREEPACRPGHRRGQPAGDLDGEERTEVHTRPRRRSSSPTALPPEARWPAPPASASAPTRTTSRSWPTTASWHASAGRRGSRASS